MRPSTIRALLGILVLAGQPLAAGVASAQCTITGPSTLCSGGSEICGPEGDYFYRWTDANGLALGEDRCLTVAAPGTYRLRTFDYLNGLWAGPCSWTLGTGVASSCTIEGPSTGCEGTPAQLCGPAAAFAYRWSGPDSFSADAPCVSVSASGTYRLEVRPDSEACWSDPCEHAIAFSRCGNDRLNCPVPPWLWLRQSAGSHFERDRLFDRTQLVAVAGCVDGHAASLSFREPGSGFARVLADRGGLRERALRQLAGVLANVCASDLGLTARNGVARGIAPSTPVALEGYTGTVAGWIATADARLGLLAHRSPRDHATKDAYRALIRVGWQINHGIGIGPVCSTRPMAVAHHEATGIADDDPADDAESLTDELRDPEQPVAIESVTPNPAPGAARVVCFVSPSASGEVLVAVYDVTGRMVRELVRGPASPGRHEYRWDGRDVTGQPVRNGAYFVIGRVGGERVEERLILLR